MPDGPVLILCDFAESINGKLYMQGAGWAAIAADTPLPIALAVLWEIPWNQANQPHDIDIGLFTEDGEPFNGPDGNQVRIEGKVEVGRPPGMKAGTSLPSHIAVKFNGLAFPVGGYRFEMKVNGSLEATASFNSVGGPL